MPDQSNYITKDILDAWVQTAINLIERNISDLKGHDDDIEEIRANLRKEVGKLYDRIAANCAVAQKELYELEARVEKEISDLKLEMKVDMTSVKIKLALWGSLGGVVATGIIGLILAAIAGKL